MTDKPVDKDPQNSVDDTATSLKQTVEAKNNSSVSGVVQANSINDSTINIHVNNRVDKDELSSKNNQNKKLHNSPKQTRFFTGRENELNQVNELFKSNKEVAISGMGGVGKTQTALKFCHLHINDYQAILWINAEKEESFNNSYYNVVDLLNLAGSSTSTSDATNNERLKVDEVISLVKRWLANNTNWLMVLDNLEDPKLIKDYLPANHQGHVLITTRSQSLKGYAAIVQLKKMSSETGTLFLLKRANLIPIDANDLEQLKLDNKFDDVLITDAQKIVQAMDGLPLALEQAGAYIQESECSLADYLKAYQDVRNTVTILDNAGEDANDHASVYATFKLNFDVVKEKSVAAAKLLEVCSFLDSDLIPEEIFTTAGKFLGDELAKLQDNNYEFNNCLKLLLGYSLIERDTNNKSLSIHRLVQTVIRELMENKNKASFAKALIINLSALLPNNPVDPANWLQYQRILPSVVSLAGLCQNHLFEPEISFLLFNNMGVYCLENTLLNQALLLFFLCLDIDQKAFGQHHLYIARTYNNIAEVYRKFGKHKEALDFYHKALSTTKQIPDTSNFTIDDIYNNIAEVYREQGKYEEALNLHQQTLSIRKQFLGNNHIDVAQSLNNIGSIYFAQAHYLKALEFYQQALLIRKQLLGNEHHYVATVLNNIANIYLRMDNYEEALSFYQQALHILKINNLDFDIAYTLNNIGEVYRNQEKHLQALNYFEQALSIYKQKYSNSKSYFAVILNNMAGIYFADGNIEKAELISLEVLKIQEELQNRNHPNTAQTLLNLALLCQQSSRETQAANYCLEALSIAEEFFSPDHPFIIKVLFHYSLLLIKLNRITEANILWKRMLIAINSHLAKDK